MKKYGSLVIILLISAIFICSYIYKKQKHEKLLLNRAFTTGTVEDLQRAVRPGRHIVYYTYKVKGVVYHDIKEYSLLRTDKQTLVNKVYPVAYQLNDPQNSELILTYKDLKNYNGKFSGEYDWVNELW